MKKTFFRKLLIAMAATLGLCLLVYPLLLPTENYFRLVLQLLLPAILVGLIMLVPLWFISDKFSKDTALELKKLRLDSSSALTQYPELRPLARQPQGADRRADERADGSAGTAPRPDRQHAGGTAAHQRDRQSALAQSRGTAAARQGTADP